MDEVQKLVKSVLYNTGKPRKVKKLLRKLEATDSSLMQRKFLMFHGLLVLKSCLLQHGRTDLPLCYQILQVLSKLPISSRNSIVDHKVDETLTKLLDLEELEIVDAAKTVYD